MQIEVPKSVKNYSDLEQVRSNIKSQIIGSYSGRIKSLLYSGAFDEKPLLKLQTEKFLAEMEEVWQAQYEIAWENN
jgi:hypothetical protein